MDFATSSARAITCVLHAMLYLGIAEDKAVDAITGAVRSALA
jgi:hypothetical protein